MNRHMLINAEEPEEYRLAIVSGQKLEEFSIEITTREQTVGNIYKGVVANIQPSLQAAFVDFGGIAVSAIAATLFFGGYDGPFVAQLPWLGPIYLLVKIVILLFGMIWVRATLPRIRYDRLMALGWKMLFPLALGTVLITAVGISVNMLWLIQVLTILFFLLVVYLAKYAIGRR